MNYTMFSSISAGGFEPGTLWKLTTLPVFGTLPYFANWFLGYLSSLLAFHADRGVQTGNSEQGMHFIVFSGVKECIKCNLLALMVRGLSSLDARASDFRLAWIKRSTDRLPCWVVGSFSLPLGVGVNHEK